ncbi:MAG: 1-deoxy-D-xylulose-5-phosphate synthase, partial [Pseudomonadota bacterium]
HFLTAEGLLGARNALRVQTMTLPDIYQDQASPKEMYEQAQLMAGDIERRALILFAQDSAAAEVRA